MRRSGNKYRYEPRWRFTCYFGVLESDYDRREDRRRHRFRGSYGTTSLFSYGYEMFACPSRP